MSYIYTHTHIYIYIYSHTYCKYYSSGFLFPSMRASTLAVAPYLGRQVADMRHVDFTPLRPFACTFQKRLVKFLVVRANVDKRLVKYNDVVALLPPTPSSLIPPPLQGYIYIYIIIGIVSTRAQTGLYFRPCVRACRGTLLLSPA